MVLILIICANLYSNGDSNFYLDKSKSGLKNYYKEVDRKSRRLDFVRFRGLSVASYDFYKDLNLDRIKKDKINLVLANVIIKDISFISDLEGVSAKVILNSEKNDKKIKYRFLKFNRVYYTDLKNLGAEKEIFAYCNSVYLNNCVLLGIGQKW